MEERQITVAGKTHKMPDLFMVLATQNPIEQEGTYPLPEAQMDRFLMKVLIDYPDVSAEEEVLRLVRSEQDNSGGKSTEESKTVEAIPVDVIFNARNEIAEIYSAPNIEQYIVRLINTTRNPKKFSDNLNDWIQIGASPRGSIGLENFPCR